MSELYELLTFEAFGQRYPELTARHQILNHVVLVDVCCTVTCYEVCLRDQVCGTDWRMSKT